MPIFIYSWEIVAELVDVYKIMSIMIILIGLFPNKEFERLAQCQNSGIELADRIREINSYSHGKLGVLIPAFCWLVIRLASWEFWIYQTRMSGVYGVNKKRLRGVFYINQRIALHFF